MNRACCWLIALIAFTSCDVRFAFSQNPVITSFTINGQLTCSNLASASIASVQWASSPTGPWQSDWSTLQNLVVGSSGIIQVSVPMFYRVVSKPPPGMAIVPGGAFTMGDSRDGEYDAIPTSITVTNFFIETNLVSFSEWEPIYSFATNAGYGFDNPGLNKASSHPVQTVNWFDVVKWCNARSQQQGLTPVYYTDVKLTQVYTSGDAVPYVNWLASGYRLPTEAEWEKASRGGTPSGRFPLSDYIFQGSANYDACTTCYPYDLGPSGYDEFCDTGGMPYTSPVGSYPPNGFGLFDMSGNVFEWCWDWYGSPYGQPATVNPTGPPSGSSRVVRGGSWINDASFARCAARTSQAPSEGIWSIGFRCVRRL